MFSSDVVSPDQSPVRDIVRPTTYYLTEKQKDDIYVNELTKSVSSATLARAINKYQKTETGEGPFRKMKQYRISNISDINRVQTHVRNLANHNNPLDFEHIRQLTEQKRSIRPTISKMNYRQKSTGSLDQLDKASLEQQFLRKQLNDHKKHELLQHKTKTLRGSLNKMSMDWAKDQPTFFKLTRQSILQFNKSRGETVSGMYNRLQDNYWSQVKSKGEPGRAQS